MTNSFEYEIERELDLGQISEYFSRRIGALETRILLLASASNPGIPSANLAIITAARSQISHDMKELASCYLEYGLLRNAFAKFYYAHLAIAIDPDVKVRDALVLEIDLSSASYRDSLRRKSIDCIGVDTLRKSLQKNMEGITEQKFFLESIKLERETIAKEILDEHLELAGRIAHSSTDFEANSLMGSYFAPRKIS